MVRQPARGGKLRHLGEKETKRKRRQHAVSARVPIESFPTDKDNTDEGHVSRYYATLKQKGDETMTDKTTTQWAIFIPELNKFWARCMGSSWFTPHWQKATWFAHKGAADRMASRIYAQKIHGRRNSKVTSVRPILDYSGSRPWYPESYYEEPWRPAVIVVPVTCRINKSMVRIARMGFGKSQAKSN